MPPKKKLNTAFYRLLAIQYLRFGLTNNEFETLLRKDKNIAEFESVSDAIRYMRKEVFPLNKKTLRWCIKYLDHNSDYCNFASIIKELDRIK
jgi:hypothetical protein